MAKNTCGAPLLVHEHVAENNHAKENLAMRSCTLLPLYSTKKDAFEHNVQQARKSSSHVKEYESYTHTPSSPVSHIGSRKGEPSVPMREDTDHDKKSSNANKSRIGSCKNAIT